MKWVVSIVVIYKNFVFIFLTLILGCKSNPNPDKSIKTIAIWGDIPHMNPFYPTDEKIWSLQSIIWEPFIVIDEKGRWHPNLALSWKLSEDKKTIILKLPQKLKWSDGTLVTKSDFEFSFNFYKYGILKASHWSPIFNNVKKIDFKQDKLTLKLKSFTGVQDWNGLLSMARLLPSDVLIDFESNIKKLKGTGIYKIKTFSSVNPWFLEVNSNYRDLREVKAYPKQLQVSKVFSRSVLQDILYKKKVFAFIDYGLQKNIKSSYHPYRSQTIYKVLAYNLKDSFLSLKKHRFCMSHFLPSSTEMQKLSNIKIDQYLALNNESSKDCLFKKNQTVVVTYTLDEDKRWLELWQQNLRPYGINLDLNKVSDNKMNEILKNKRFQIYVTDMRDHYNQYPWDVFHSQGLYNSQGWDNKKLDRLLIQKQKQFDVKEILKLNTQIRTFIEQEKGSVYFYSYQQPLARTLHDCKTQTPFFWQDLLRCS